MAPPNRGELLGLLADARDHPDEDGLRLILADWLEENGTAADRARAELIRCQVEFDRLGPESPRRAECGRRARLLQQEHRTAWLGPLAGWARAWSHHRGLLTVHLPPAQLRSQAVQALAGGETWAWVDAVYLAAAHEYDVARLRDCALLASVGTLGFHQGNIGPAGAQALAELPLLGRLGRLDLTSQEITDRGLARLLASPHLRRLRVLELPGAWLTAEAGRVLAESAALLGLRRLVLHGNQLGDQGVSPLALAAGPALRSLDLRGNGLGDAAARSLAAAPGLGGLRELNLADNNIGTAGATALAQAAGLTQLSALILWGNPVGQAGARLLQERFGPRVHVSPLRA